MANDTLPRCNCVNVRWRWTPQPRDLYFRNATKPLNPKTLKRRRPFMFAEIFNIVFSSLVVKAITLSADTSKANACCQDNHQPASLYGSHQYLLVTLYDSDPPRLRQYPVPFGLCVLSASTVSRHRVLRLQSFGLYSIGQAMPDSDVLYSILFCDDCQVSGETFLTLCPIKFLT